jgi:transcription-repair coupling factor
VISEARIFHLDKITAELRGKTLLSVNGLGGSPLLLFITELLRAFPQVVYLTDTIHLVEQTQKLKRLNRNTALIDNNHMIFTHPEILVTTTEYMLKPVLKTDTITLSPHQKFDLEELIERLILTGLTREDTVEDEGEFAVRGGIIDIFMPDAVPVRLELFGDEVVSIRQFSVSTQRSVNEIPTITLLCAEKTLHVPLVNLLPRGTVIVSEQLVDVPFPTILMGHPEGIEFHFSPAHKYFGDLQRLKNDIRRRLYAYRFLLQSPAMVHRLESVLGKIDASIVPIEEGFIDEVTKTVYLTESEIFGTVLRKKHRYKGPFVDDLVGLKENDYVVHADYGIGQFKGLVMITTDDIKAECLQINYAGKDKVFLPIERLNLIERFVATSDRPPRLSKLGSDLWLRTKKRIKKATERLAIDLLKLYSRRAQEPGFPFSRDTAELRELEASFPFVETKDQLQAITDMKKDMESAQPAERLICGDVGYGKTEIALRAAFKAALDGKQSMLLCPTTLLAFQHYNTFKNRLAFFPVHVEMVSRFRNKEEINRITKDIAKGKVDIAIGTHRLLQPDVHFKTLGLLIVDEEQRFGVAQKEKIKSLKPGIDCFYLSATPIPRTLYMALTGLKSISNIYTPPPGRKDIATQIMYYDEEELRKAISFELARNGQVFFVHNRIQTIDTVKQRLQKILPGLSVCVLHGRMREDVTARRMVDFLGGKYQVLLSTAIVESGLDMPRVNTIIVDQAHTFGLADLHQLRGRVGRSDTQAYAYFIVPSVHKLTPEAHKRLGALSSYTMLGSGFRLAIRDMEIRGVGNLLGKEQSGHINAIGYHLYVNILSEAIDEIRGQRTVLEPVLDLKTDAYLPSDYIESAYERTALYKRVLGAESQFEVESIKQEITDRFGRYPKEVKNLFRLAEVRLKAKDMNATEVVKRGKDILYYTEGKVIHRE